MLCDDENDDQATQVRPLQSIAKGKERNQPGQKITSVAISSTQRKLICQIVSDAVLKKL